MPIRGVLLLAFFVGSLPVCFLRPFYGILLWTVIAFLNPQSSFFYWSTANSFPWAVAVAIPTLIGFAAAPKALRNLASIKVFLIIVMWLWFTITSVVSTRTPLFMHHSEDTWYRWNYFSKVVLMMLVTMAIVNSFERLRILVLVMASCLGFYVAKSFPFVVMTGGAFRLYGPEFSMIADNNDFGLALNMTLPIFFYLAQTEVRRWVRWVCGVLFVITIPAIFFTYSRGALTGLIVVSTFMLLRSKQRLLLIPIIGFAIVFALLFAPASWKHRMDPTRPDAIDGSAQSRLNAWSYSWNLAKDYPIAGGGFGTFTSQLFEIYAPKARDIHGPHSVYFQVLAEHGFVGLTLYLALIAACFVSVFGLVRRANFYDDPTVIAYTNMFRFSLVGFLTSGIFLGRAYFDYFFSIVACLAVLEKLALQGWASRLEEDQEGEAESGLCEGEVLLPEGGSAL